MVDRMEKRKRDVPAHASQANHSTFLSKRVDVLLKVVFSDKVDHKVDTLVVGLFQDHLFEILRFIVDSTSGRALQAQKSVNFLLRSCGGEDFSCA